MERIVDQLRELLQQAGEGIRDARLPRELADRMEALISRLDEPCVLTVVGRAKAGKSTFVNALLGEDLAKVGVTETTATINFFRHGQPEDPNLPVRCYWRRRSSGVNFRSSHIIETPECPVVTRVCVLWLCEGELAR